MSCPNNSFKPQAVLTQAVSTQGSFNPRQFQPKEHFISSPRKSGGADLIKDSLINFSNDYLKQSLPGEH